MSLSLSMRRAPRADQSDTPTPFGVPNDQEAPGGRVANRDPAALADRVIGILECHGNRIVEDSCSFFESHAVLRSVCYALVPIPLESHRVPCGGKWGGVFPIPQRLAKRGGLRSPDTHRAR